MASQYEIMKKNYDEYVKRPLVNPKVVGLMLYKLGYANTIDPEVNKEAERILRGEE